MIRRSEVALNRESGLKLLVMMELWVMQAPQPEIPLAPSKKLASGVGAQRRLNSKPCHLNGSWPRHRITPPSFTGANANANAHATATADLPHRRNHFTLRLARAGRSGGKEGLDRLIPLLDWQDSTR